MLWQIAEDPDVTTMLDAACEESPRLREAWEGLLWLLARRPDVGHALGLGERIRVHKQEGYLSIGIPTITVLYDYNATTITLRAIVLRSLGDELS